MKKTTFETSYVSQCEHCGMPLHCFSCRMNDDEESCSSDEDASTTSLLDSLLGGLGEELGLDNDGDLGEDTLAEDLEIALQEYIK